MSSLGDAIGRGVHARDGAVRSAPPKQAPALPPRASDDGRSELRRRRDALAEQG
jgi:hypothetical protein